MLKADGIAETEKEGGAAIVTASVSVVVRLPDTPVIVAMAVTGAAELVAVNVSVLLVVVLAGLKDAVTPGGSPETESVTALEKPESGMTLITVLPLVPGATESDDGDAARLKAGELATPVKLLISVWPAGVPQPVARS